MDFERSLAGVDGALLDFHLLIGRARGTGELLALLRQVEDDLTRILGAVGALPGERAFPFASKVGGGLGGNSRRERGENECKGDEFFHGGFLNDVGSRKVASNVARAGLFRPQGDHRIYTRSSVRRDVARDQGHRKHHA